jgi:hypothetical protein
MNQGKPNNLVKFVMDRTGTGTGNIDKLSKLPLNR